MSAKQDSASQRGSRFNLYEPENRISTVEVLSARQPASPRPDALQYQNKRLAQLENKVSAQ
jgi:hypothetical protein